jgi:hypothetical protein
MSSISTIKKCSTSPRPVSTLEKSFQKITKPKDTSAKNGKRKKKSSPTLWERPLHRSQISKVSFAIRPLKSDATPNEYPKNQRAKTNFQQS